MVLKQVASAGTGHDPQRALELRLQSSESWRALIQLDAREDVGEWLDVVEGGLLRQGLLRELALNDDFKAWADLVHPLGWPLAVPQPVVTSTMMDKPALAPEATGPARTETFRTRVKLKIAKVEPLRVPEAGPIVAELEPVAGDEPTRAVMAAPPVRLPVPVLVPEDYGPLYPPIVQAPTAQWLPTPRPEHEPAPASQSPAAPGAATAQSPEPEGRALRDEIVFQPVWPGAPAGLWSRESVTILSRPSVGEQPHEGVWPLVPLRPIEPSRPKENPATDVDPQALVARTPPLPHAGGRETGRGAEYVSRIEHEVDALTRGPAATRLSRPSTTRSLAQSDTPDAANEAEVQIIGARHSERQAERPRDVMLGSLGSTSRSTSRVSETRSYAAPVGDAEEASVVIVRRERSGNATAGEPPGAMPARGVRQFLRSFTAREN